MNDKNKYGSTQNGDMKNENEKSGDFKGQKGGQTSNKGRDLEDLNDEDADSISDMEE